MARRVVVSVILILVFLRWFQTDGWNWTSLLGYYATAALLYLTADAMIGRLRRRERRAGGRRDDARRPWLERL